MPWGCEYTAAALQSVSPENSYRLNSNDSHEENANYHMVSAFISMGVLTAESFS